MISALQDAVAIMNEMFSMGASNESLTDARKFAKDNDLRQLEKLIDAYAALPKMNERLQDLWDRWLNAGVNVESLKSHLDAKRAELQAAADALDNCVQKDEAEMVQMTIFWITNKGPHTEWWNVWAVDAKSEYHDTHFELSWRDAAGPHKEEWNASVFVRGGTGYLALSGIKKIDIPSDGVRSREWLRAEAQRATGLEFRKRPSP
jgi:hypothetical protein